MSGGEASRGIVVLGSPRSGTTLLRRILNAHPSIACPGETNLFTGCGRFLREEKMADGTAIGPISGLSFMGVDAARVLEDLRHLSFGYLDDYASSQGKSRWAEKTAFNAFYLEELEPLWSDRVVYVVILRHGLDVALSIRDLCDVNGAYLDELHDYVRADRIPVLAFARAWADVTRELLDFTERHAENSFVMRYEDLVTNADDVLSSLFGFLKEPWTADLLKEVFDSFEGVGLGDWKTYEKKEISRQSVDKWRRLPTHLLSGLSEIVNPTLERCGYEPVRVEAKPHDARRRYELALMMKRLKAGD